MKLSEAIMLGSATCKMVAGDINSCALGAALNAVGAEKHTLRWVTERSNWIAFGGMKIQVPAYTMEGHDRNREVYKYWPWLGDRMPSVKRSFLDYGVTGGNYVAALFDYSVVEGRMTLEQLADHIAAVEPQCGCNRFDCRCAKNEEDRAERFATTLLGGDWAAAKTTKEEEATCA